MGQKASEFKDGDKVPVGKMTEILIDHGQDRKADVTFQKIRGDVQYKQYLDKDGKEVLVICPQSSDKPIEITIWSVWFEEKQSFQLDLELIAEGRGPPPPDPDKPSPVDPDPPVSDLTKVVSDLADKMGDRFTRNKLKTVYEDAAEAVRSSSELEIEYFSKKYTYDMGDLDSASSHVVDAVSKTIAYAKSVNRVSESKDWYEGFRKPLNEKTKGIDLKDRLAYSNLLKAISEGL